VPPRLTVETEIYASHHQFYVADPDGEQTAELWDGGGLERHLGVAEGCVAVGTVGACDVPVRIELWDEEAPLDLDDWDHVVEATLEVRLGKVALGWVGGQAELEPLDVPPGTYRLRSSAAGLDGADEMDGGDSYRVQLWLAPSGEPEVIKWWTPWDPSGIVAAPTTTECGRLLVGAEAEDRRREMSWLASRGSAHLFRDHDGTYWEHSNLRDTRGTPQLEELSAEEAASRYGSPERWAPPFPLAPGLGTMLRSILQTLRYRRGWRPTSDAEEKVVDGKRVYLGGQAIARTYTVRWVASVGGDNLHIDDEGVYWEWRNEDAASGNSQLREVTASEARAKYGIDAEN
jgi:hypothetical protein